MDSGKLVLGVLAGLAIGATLGILFAPDKGSVTRKKVMKKGEEYVGDLEEKFDDFMSEIKERFEAMKEEAQDTAENIRRKAKKEAEGRTSAN